MILLTLFQCSCTVCQPQVDSLKWLSVSIAVYWQSWNSLVHFYKRYVHIPVQAGEHCSCRAKDSPLIQLFGIRGLGLWRADDGPDSKSKRAYVANWNELSVPSFLIYNVLYIPNLLETFTIYFSWQHLLHFVPRHGRKLLSTTDYIEAFHPSKRISPIQ